MIEGYDIIGDIHGEGDALERLLQELDYKLIDGCWQHPSIRAQACQARTAFTYCVCYPAPTPKTSPSAAPVHPMRPQGR